MLLELSFLTAATLISSLAFPFPSQSFSPNKKIYRPFDWELKTPALFLKRSALAVKEEGANKFDPFWRRSQGSAVRVEFFIDALLIPCR